jgi:hypothetical protein
MPVETIIDRKNRLVIHKANVSISIEDIISAFHVRLTAPDFIPGMNVLWDFRDVHGYSLQREDILHIVSYLKNKVKINVPYKAGLLVSGDFEFGMARMFEMLAETTDMSISVFKNLTEARAWLLSEDTVESRSRKFVKNDLGGKNARKTSSSSLREKR